MGAWASTQDVKDITGSVVSAQQLAQAQASVEMFCNRIWDDSDRIRARDLYWLRYAVAYQAAWEAGQYDLNTRLDTTNVQQDGVVGTLPEKAVILGPRAKQALQRVSWMRSRTVHIRSPFVDRGDRGAHPLSESSDEGQDWEPMGGGS